MKRKLSHLSILCLLVMSTHTSAQSESASYIPPLRGTRGVSPANSFAQTNINTDSQNTPLEGGIDAARPHVAALRQQLGLSSHLELQWRPSQTGADTFSVTDNFNRSDIGPDWALDTRYWAIRNGELVLTEAATYEWRYLAVFLPIFSDGEREIFSVAYNWGKHADSVGIGEGAHALMIDAPSTQGGGYWLWRRTNQKSVWLYAIKNGTWEYAGGETKEYHRVDAHRPIPQAGDLITAIIRNEPQAVYFDYYINDYRDGTVYDASREFARANTWYTGVFIHGQGLNNQIDNFTVTWLDGEDTVAPAAVTDLRAIDSSATNVTLAWTSPGDNFLDGQADHLEIRYDTAPLNEDNFSSAKLASNIPVPVAGGEQQQFTINGLKKERTYYFALRAYDEANNISGLSNVVQTFTKQTSVATALELVSGCEQTGTVGEALPLPIVARVKDQESAPFANYPVQFVIKSGEASFANGATDLNVKTDGEGRAAAEIKLGTTSGEIEIEISAAGLSNSPLRCRAIVMSGTPADLIQVSGDRQVLSAGMKADPLLVRVTDAHGNSIVEAPVTFAIAAGAGIFVNAQASYQTKTEPNGTASAELFASEVAGDTTTVAVTMSEAVSNTNLQTVFFIYTAAADSLRAVSGDGQIAPVRTELRDPLVVRVLDALHAPVKNFPVLFRVLAGAGLLGNGNSAITIATDSTGSAATTWTLGPNPGANQVSVEVQGLKGSPLIFNATGDIISHVDESTITLPKEFALLPNSPNPFNPETMIHFALPEPAEVTLMLYDATGRRVRSLMNAAMNAGAHHVRWDGRAANGRALDSGIYFCRMRAVAKASGKNFEATRKLVLAK